MKRPLAIAGTAAFAALCFLCFFPYAALPVLLAGLAGCLLAFLLRRKICWKALCCFCAVAAAASGLFFARYELQYASILRYSGATVSVQAHLEEKPEWKNGSYTYLFQTDQINGENLRTGIRMYSWEELPISPYDTVRMTAVLGPSWNSEDMRMYALSSGVLLQAEEVALLSVTPAEGELPLRYRIVQLRERLSASISENLGAENAGLLRGILFGDKSGITEEITQDFRQLGISHLLAVSGLHMSVWAMTLFSLLNKARLRRRSAALVTAGFVLFFMALTGFTPSVMRSGLMLLLYLGAFWFKRKPDSLNSLGASLLIILCLNPFDAGSVGLILSALATFGILTLHTRLARWYTGRLNSLSFRPGRRIIKAVAEVLSISLCATLFTMPVSMLAFGSISLMSPLGNLLIAGFAAPAMISGGLAAAANAVGMAGMSQPLFAVSGWFLRLIIQLSQDFADIPFVSVFFQADQVPAWLFIFVCTGTVMGVLLIKRMWIPVTAYLMALILLIGAVAGSSSRVFRDQAVLQIASGSNPCVLIRSEGQSVLIGSGKNGMGIRLLEENNLYRVQLLFFWEDDPAADQIAVARRCRWADTIRQGESFHAELEGGMVLSSDGKGITASVNGRTIRIQENLVQSPEEIWIAGGLSAKVDYAGRIAVETNGSYARGTNALTVPINGVIIIEIDRNSQVTVDGGTACPE